jgi:hypothetical protein
LAFGFWLLASPTQNSPSRELGEEIMPIDLVKRAIARSREREPVVTAMALLHGARVLAAVDRESAKRTYAEGCVLAEALTLNPQTRDFALCEAVNLGAAVDPMSAVALFRGLPEHGHGIFRQSTGVRLVQALAQSGEFELAIALLEDSNCPAAGATNVLHLAPDLALQRRAMAAARKRWRMPRRPGPQFEEREFVLLFAHHWLKLESAEQKSWLEEILQAIAAEAATPANASFGEVTLHSMGDMHLFQILHVLRALKPADEVEAILRAHPDVAKGAEIYPLGMESLLAQARAQAGNKSCGTGGGFAWAGATSDRPLMEAMMKVHRGDPSAVEDMMAEALRRFAEDKDGENPNKAPVPFWPSCRAYQSAMYWAGKTRAMDGAALLEEIPDTDLALLASIELAAGVLGLPECSGVRIGPARRRSPSSGRRR